MNPPNFAKIRHELPQNKVEFRKKNINFHFLHLAGWRVVVNTDRGAMDFRRFRRGTPSALRCDVHASWATNIIDHQETRCVIAGAVNLAYRWTSLCDNDQRKTSA